MCLTCVHHGAQATMARVGQHGGALRWVSVELQRDREVVIEAVRQNSRALQCAAVGLSAWS